MSEVEYAEKISSIMSDVKTASYDEKREQPTEEQVNGFLEAISSLRNFLEEKTHKIDHLTNGLEELSWLTNLNEDNLKAINELISGARDLRRSLIKTYVRFNTKVKSRGMMVVEINNYKRSIDDLTETINDIESVYFYLPKNPDFLDVTSLLSKL